MRAGRALSFIPRMNALYGTERHLRRPCLWSPMQGSAMTNAIIGNLPDSVLVKLPCGAVTEVVGNQWHNAVDRMRVSRRYELS